VYGGRWELAAGPVLGSGGQGTVFRVTDRTGTYQGEYALKRVPDIKRRERFRREIAAIKRLTDPETHQAHPNIIPLIDHSALDYTAAPEKQFLVMPIANGGDLSDPGRIGLHKDSIDGVLQVAKQVARALSAAHAAGIVHRDVKPKNILFTGFGHELWLSDFGICLIRETPRVTESHEVMGPRTFMAPEFEEGGQLDVTPSADIYSLGKVIYYMLSGGIILPRQRLDEEQFRRVFARGERYRLVEHLLSRMICLQDQRIASVDEVIQQIEKIEGWESNARLLPVSDTALAGLAQIQRRSLEAHRIVLQSEHTRNQETRVLGTVQRGVTDWLSAELQKFSAKFSSFSIKFNVGAAGIPNGQFQVQTGDTSLFRAMNGIELTFEDVHDPSHCIHVLQFFLCKHEWFSNAALIQARGASPKVRPDGDLQLALLPFYRKTSWHLPPNTSTAPGYISRKNQIGTARHYIRMPPSSPRNEGTQIRFRRVEPLSTSFENDLTLHVTFCASEWPGNEEQLRRLLTEAIDAFIALINAS
jgi:serine/threonine protein kinase